MTSPKKNWQRVRDLFHSALDYPAAEREAFLTEACAEEDGLLEEVRALLSFHADPMTLAPLGGAGSHTPPADGKLDRYELLDIVGQGGMGTVYRARRADGTYDDEVAIKLLHQDLSGESFNRRFRQERQILADLRHPAIARLLDGGTFGEDRPFLVMEYVEGEPIDAFCDRQVMKISQRLELFRKVCQVVHFAHQNLIVHRDLKPGNILVTPSGEPKLLDFGLAKLMDPSAPELTRYGPEDGAAPMTPDFASPEQVSGGIITTATDVYSLGALLYVLLTGSRPLPSNHLALLDFVQAVCHEMPKPPSTRFTVSSPDSDLPEGQSLHSLRKAAAARSSDPQRLSRELSGDLDRIVAKALAKDPAERYPSAEDFRRDIDRHLRGHPVLAQDPTFSYRAGKFLRRHRWPVALTTAILLTITGLALGLLLQRNQLLREQAESREVTRFLEGLFEVSTPEQARGRPITARELLDQGVLDVRGRLAEQPRLRAQLIATMGRVYLKLGHLEEAEALLVEALNARRSLAPLPRDEVAESLLDLADLEAAQGRYGDAEELYGQARRMVEKLGSEGGEPGIRGLSGLARAKLLQGDHAEAERLQEAGLRDARELLGDEHENIAEGLLQLGEILREQGDFEEAAEAYEGAAAIYEGLYTEEHPKVTSLLHQLALLREEQGLFPESEEILRRALAVQQVLYPEDHPEIAETTSTLASVLHQLGRLDEAEATCRRALELRRDALEEGHPSVGTSLNLLGVILLDRDDLAGAEASLREARGLFRQRLGGDHPQVAAATNNLARVLERRGEWSQAEAELEESLRIYRETFGEEHLQVATVLNNLAVLNKRQGDLVEAGKLYEQALRILHQTLGEDHPRAAALSHNLGVLHVDLKDPKLAEGYYRQALAGFAKALPAQHPTLGHVRKNLAIAILDQGRPEEARTLLDEALEIYRIAGEEGDSLGVLVARRILSDVLVAQGQSHAAIDLLEEDLPKAIQRYGPDSEAVILTVERLERLGKAP